MDIFRIVSDGNFLEDVILKICARWIDIRVLFLIELHFIQLFIAVGKVIPNFLHDKL